MTRVDVSETDFGGRLRRAVNGSFTNTQSRSDLRPGEPFCAQCGNSVHVRIDAWAAELFSLRSRVAQASFYTLDNQAALQFGDGAENRKDQFAEGLNARGRFEPLLKEAGHKLRNRNPT
jgi:hypothetical protein